MLTPKDWKSLRFSRTRAAVIAEWLLAAATIVYVAMAASFLQTAQQVAAIRNTSLTELLQTVWTGVNPHQSYPGTLVMALEPLMFAIICLAIGIVIGILLVVFASLRRRNQRFMVFLDRYQSSFSGALPEDEDIEDLIGSV
jgi:ABC-type phosphate transport system permease subunit